jgi:alkaline phosphatase
VFAFGKGADNFLGNMNNVDIATKIFALLED